MSIPEGTRELVRQRAGFSCEFCGIHETDAGGELTIDHYRPQAHGGDDDPDGLIYACSRCNLYKHDYWPETRDAPRLWNPREEPFATHFKELSSGILEALSPTGTFTMRQLRLNRPQLVANRKRRRQAAAAQAQIRIYQGIIAVLGQLLTEQASAADQQTELFQVLRQLLEQLLDSRR